MPNPLHINRPTWNVRSKWLLHIDMRSACVESKVSMGFVPGAFMQDVSSQGHLSHGALIPGALIPRGIDPKGYSFLGA